MSSNVDHVKALSVIHEQISPFDGELGLGLLERCLQSIRNFGITRTRILYPNDEIWPSQGSNARPFYP